ISYVSKGAVAETLEQPVSLRNLEKFTPLDDTQVQITVPIEITQSPSVPVFTIWINRIVRAGWSDPGRRRNIGKRTVAIVEVNERSLAIYTVNRDQNVEESVIIDITPARAAPGFVQRIAVNSGTV